ncbi:uncharacterized protein BCR38DRAFT_484612 [Pseudomassariella vexata]|uniref:CCHC-type domain-containing protein n=1 Tax=Pseudomassariella vexata TaxID=1141098 RepID=A0A1Y2E0T3_9PEZI|nr:uncharacterized protein BCR38DRAFT_484612 [Pseudomassariella vexata]ORY65148.1 hypothetical protein BCR38DRAFT_484612 [Pseudomassariella vexata]
MADGPPGQDAAQSEPPPCYNCGVKGHMFMACPEPARATPAGLEAARARKQSGSYDRGDGDGGSKRHKGPIVTRYAQPARPGPVITRYEPPPPSQQYSHGPGQSYPPIPLPLPLPPPPPSSQQQYPPAYSLGYPPQRPYNTFGPPGLPPPPPPPPGAPHLYGPQPYGQPPFNSLYGPPGAHGLPIPPPGQFQRGPPPPYPPPPHYPLQPPAYGYPGPPQGPAPGYAPPPSSGSYPNHASPGYLPYPPNLPPNFQPPYHDDHTAPHFENGHERHRDDHPSRERWDDRHGSAQSHNELGRNHPNADRYNGCERRGDRRPHDRQGNNRFGNERRRDQRGRRDNRDRRRDRPRSRSPSGSTPGGNQHSSLTLNTPSQSTPIDPAVASGVEVSGPEGTSHFTAAEESVTDEDKSESEDGELQPGAPDEDLPYPEFAWDKATIFKEISPAHKGDSIGEPLPAEHTDRIMLPPPFNAPFVKSKHITPDNLDDFALSVRDTDEWQKLKHHPAFLDVKAITPQSLEVYASISGKPRGRKDDRRDRSGQSKNPGKNWNKDRGQFARDGRDSRRRSEGKRKRRWEDSQPQFEASNPDCHQTGQTPESKKRRQMSPEPGEVTDSGSPPSDSSRQAATNIRGDGAAQAAEASDISNKTHARLDSQAGRSGERRFSDHDWPTYRLDSNIPYEGYGVSRRQHERQSDPRRYREGHLTSQSYHDYSEPRRHGEEDNNDRDYHRRNTRSRSFEPRRRSDGFHATNTKNSEKDIHYEVSHTPPPQSKESLHGSRPTSRHSSYDRLSEGSAASPLTPIEAELLGMGDSDTDSGKRSPIRQPEPAPLKKKRQTKVDAAYSRRW